MGPDYCWCERLRPPRISRGVNPPPPPPRPLITLLIESWTLSAAIVKAIYLDCVEEIVSIFAILIYSLVIGVN